ncbi:hypothetical protein G3M48_009035 [Beauveria asiatica]|uniref:Uncharacterized protein n=1 Tax=Beauveria asiatica TaxID=1069075 RepID=A0AAW0S3J0_9HYPO
MVARSSATAASPFHGMFAISASLSGPDTTFPIPLPIARNPHTMMGSNALPPPPSSPLAAVTCRMMPGQRRQPAPQPPEQEDGRRCAPRRHEDARRHRPPVRQPAHGHATNYGRAINHQQRQRGLQPARAQHRPRVRRQVDARHKVPQRLDDVGRLVQQKRALKDEAEIDAAAPRGGRRQPRLHKVHEREGAGKQRGGPDAQRDAEPVAAEQKLEQQRRGDAAEARPGPHDAVGEALAPHEPLVHVEDARAVGDGPAERVQHALRRHQLRRRLRERAESQRCAHDHNAARRRVPRLLGVQPEQRHHERDVQVHDALRARVSLRGWTDGPGGGSAFCYYQRAGANDGNLGRARKGFMRRIVALKNTKRKRES